MVVAFAFLHLYGNMELDIRHVEQNWFKLQSEAEPTKDLS